MRPNRNLPRAARQFMVIGVVLLISTSCSSPGDESGESERVSATEVLTLEATPIPALEPAAEPPAPADTAYGGNDTADSASESDRSPQPEQVVATTLITADDTSADAAAPAAIALSEPLSDANLPGTDVSLTLGVWTVEPGVSLNVRTAPTGEVVDTIQPGDEVDTTGRGRDIDGVVWGEVKLPDGSYGWAVIGVLIAAPSALIAPPPPPPPVAPVATTAPEATVDPVATTAPEATADPVATAAPEATTAPEATVDPVATTAPEATVDPVATTAPEATAVPQAPATTDNVDLVPLVTTPGRAWVSSAVADPGVPLLLAPDPYSDLQAVIPAGSEISVLQAEGWYYVDLPLVYVAFQDVVGWVDARVLTIAPGE